MNKSTTEFLATHTHLCCFKWAMARWPMSRLYTASGKPTAATPWLAACRASSRDDFTAVTDKTRPPLETTLPSFKAVPAWKICSPMSWIRDNPEEPRCYTNSSKHYNVRKHSICPKNLDVVFSVKHLQKLMHYINLIIFCNKMCMFFFFDCRIITSTEPQTETLTWRKKELEFCTCTDWEAHRKSEATLHLHSQTILNKTPAEIADFLYLWFRLLSCRSRGNRHWPWPQWLQSCPGATRGRWRPVCHSWCSWSLHIGRSATAAAAPGGKWQERRETLSFKERRCKGGRLPVKHTPDTRGLRSGS